MRLHRTSQRVRDKIQWLKDDVYVAAPSACTLKRRVTRKFQSASAAWPRDLCDRKRKRILLVQHEGIIVQGRMRQDFCRTRAVCRLCCRRTN